MATCKLCNRSGLFLKITKLGVCTACAPAAEIEILSRWRVIRDSMSLVSKSKNMNTRLQRCQDIISNAEALLRYENAGLKFQKSPSSLLATYNKMPQVIVSEGVMAEAEKASQKLHVAVTSKAKITVMSKLLLFIVESQTKAEPDQYVQRLESNTRAGIHELQLQSYLEEAEKAELKGQKKKALDRYYEALYFLQHDEIEDSLQAGTIREIEVKIELLSGSKPQIIEATTSQ